ncbi:MAG: peptidoglycan bridge formation glycyltransferase FemA/FemB family protein [Candidatus Nomurabacteria bacterium]|nr:peptidoglycan bridge formation glycyltransferase FemA/FemB family protein [Candidatus Nomurabacteria bacterium]
MEKHFLQSESWKKFQESLGKQVFEDSGSGWGFLATLETTPFGSYLYLPYGPTSQDDNTFQGALKALKSLAHQQDVLFIRIEPTNGVSASTLEYEGFVRIKEINPEHTWVLNLEQSREAILAGMKQNNRNLFNTYKSKSITIHHTSNTKKIVYLTSLLAGVATHNKINTHSATYLSKQMSEAGAILYYAVLNDPNLTSASIFSQEKSGLTNTVTTGMRNVSGSDDSESAPAIIAAALVYDSPTTRYYAHGAADHEHRKLGAGTALLAQMIIDAKDKGLKTFDFYGITESADPHHPWYGFTKFKKSFGGEPRNHLGTWDLPLKKARYRAFTHLRAANRKLRKLIKK